MVHFYLFSFSLNLYQTWDHVAHMTEIRPMKSNRHITVSSTNNTKAVSQELIIMIVRIYGTMSWTLPLIKKSYVLTPVKDKLKTPRNKSILNQNHFGSRRFVDLLKMNLDIRFRNTCIQQRMAISTHAFA